VIERRWHLHVITTDQATAIGAEEYTVHDTAQSKPIILQVASIYVPRNMDRLTALQYALSEIVLLSDGADSIYVKCDDMRVHHLKDDILKPFKTSSIRLKWTSKKRLGDAVLLAEDALNRKSTIIESL
jgi:hypothetical protein